MPPPPEIAANWPYFGFDLVSDFPDPPTTRLVRVSDRSEIGLPVFAPWTPIAPLAAHPLEDLVVGEQYDLHHPRCEFSEPLVTRYVAVAPIAAPEVLGTLTVSELYAANRIRGAENREYFVVIELTPDPAAFEAPWREVLTWEAGADGSVVRTEPASIMQNRGRIPVACDGGIGLFPGTRAFRADGYVVRERLLFVTPEAPATIGACEDAVRVDADTLRPLRPEEIEFWDTLPADAGIDFDAGLDAGPGTRSRASGCACEVATSTGTPSAWLVVLALLVGTLTIRRRAKQ